MGAWEPKKGWEKVNLLMREDFHRELNVRAAKTGKRPWQIMDSILAKEFKAKKKAKGSAE